jgi:hypothetical protein
MRRSDMRFGRKSTGAQLEDRIKRANDRCDKARETVKTETARASEVNEALHAFLGISSDSDHQTLEEAADKCRAAGGQRAVELDEILAKFVAASQTLMEAGDEARAALGELAALVPAGKNFDPPEDVAFRDFGFGGTGPEPLLMARAFKPKDRPPHVFVMRPFPADDNDEQVVKLVFTKHQMLTGEELWFPEFAEMAERCTEVSMHFWTGRG